MNRFAWIIAGLCVATIAAAPATKPTTRPTTRPSTRPAKPDSSMSVVENATYHFRVSVPKVWKLKKAEEKGSVYSVPGPGGEAAGGYFVLQSADAVHGKTTLDQVIESKRTSLLELAPGSKITHEESITVDGRAAWRLEYTVPTTAKETAIIDGHAGEPKEVTILQKAREVMTMNGQTVVDMTYIAEQTVYEARAKLADKVVDSLIWTGDGPNVNGPTTKKATTKESK